MLTFSPKTCAEIAAITGARIAGSPETIVKGLNGLEDAREGELSFFSDPKYAKFLNTTSASCIIVPDSYAEELPEGRTYLYSENPHDDFVLIMKTLYKAKEYKPGIHPSAVIADGAVIPESAHVGPLCIIGSECSIGENAVLVGNVTLYDNITIGSDTMIHSNVVVCSGTVIGSRCIIHPGAVIGSDGFGYKEHKDGSYEKVPQLGNVIIEDDVDIGSNTTIDRAMIGRTIIEKGVKLDNLIHIAHNVRVGQNTAMAAQVGISGSTKVGSRNRYGGQVGLAGHLEVPDDVVILAQSGVASTIDKKGVYFGSPARPHRHAFRIEAVINQLPELMMDLNKLKKRFEEKFGE